MAIAAAASARPLWRFGLCSSLTSVLARSASTASSASPPVKQSRGRSDGERKAPKANRWIPTAAASFYDRNGCISLRTEAKRWFIENNIGFDHATASRFGTHGELARALKAVACSVAFTPHHLVSSYHLPYFDPSGDPQVFSIMDMYERKNLEEPLWVHIQAGGPDSTAVVRSTVTGRLRYHTLSALSRLGYSAIGEWHGPNGEYKEIWGTLVVSCTNPVTAANKSVERLGTLIAEALVAQYSKTVQLKDATISVGGRKVKVRTVAREQRARAGLAKTGGEAQQGGYRAENQTDDVSKTKHGARVDGRASRRGGRRGENTDGGGVQTEDAFNTMKRSRVDDRPIRRGVKKGRALDSGEVGSW
ncbi:hypothetical protein B0I35DRAFT_484130 [Stachybotrys elegans]|uniref:Uncharacterized protein n=1 Tax=Stachybotrys elegans TaxID=80388 RepID=A0A8K0WKN3_9HYPO|nr:hypothetical protein B0I35DRAFT_484130 [Stachybotrys elegans]